MSKNSVKPEAKVSQIIEQIAKEAPELSTERMFPNNLRAPINETPVDEPVPVRMDALLEEISSLNLDINTTDESIAFHHNTMNTLTETKSKLVEKRERSVKELRKIMGEKL